MPGLKRMSGREVISVLRDFGFEEVSQRGSHIKLRRTGQGGERETLVIPDHSELDTGTLRAIIRQASRYISAEDLQPHFYR
ncbi:MAG: type II toxin-antitoxin system HicA family toxin [Candidatus Hydrogenedentes bacterium]|nr:type II toxin-antitoxin system HicA family toxin [Candidatus Hydrogenedentota bacterium]